MNRIFLAFATTVFVVSSAFAGDQSQFDATTYYYGIIGKWLGRTKFEIYYADGTWAVQRNEDADLDKSGRYWKVSKNRFIQYFPGGTTTGTISFLDKYKFRGLCS